MKGGIYMNTNCLIYNSSLKSPTDFIDSILYHELKEQIPTCDFEETSNFYYININSFCDDKHSLEISYKFNFFILTIVPNSTSRKILFQRSFYFPQIDLNHILLHDCKDTIKLVIPKVI